MFIILLAIARRIIQYTIYESPSEENCDLLQIISTQVYRYLMLPCFGCSFD